MNRQKRKALKGALAVTCTILITASGIMIGKAEESATQAGGSLRSVLTTQEEWGEYVNNEESQAQESFVQEPESEEPEIVEPELSEPEAIESEEPETVESEEPELSESDTIQEQDVMVMSEDGDEGIMPMSEDGDGGIMPMSVVESGTCGANLTWTLDDEGLLTISGTGTMTNWGGGVTAPWSASSSQIKSIAIENGVTSIGAFAFNYCSSVKTITIPSSVNSIERYAFGNCTLLRQVEIPAGVTVINQGTFNKCTWLNKVTIPNTVTTIAASAFSGCVKITEIDVPSSVTSIASYAFAECNSLTSMVVPEGITEIPDYAFANCTSLTSISLPTSITRIGTCGFNNCKVLPSIVIPEGVTMIEDSAFGKCYKLAEVSFPQSLKYINVEAFYYCSDLNNVVIPSGVLEVGLGAFSNCADLSNIEFKGSAPNMGTNLFQSDTLTAYYPGGDSSWTESVRQNYGGNVTWVPNVVTKPITSLAISRNNVKALKGTTVTLKSTVYPSDTSDSKNITWSTSNNTVADVSAQGVISMKTTGDATITAVTSNGITRTCKVKVVAPITAVSLNKKSTEIEQGKTEALTASVAPTDTTDSKTLTWSSSNNSVATVNSSGTVTAVSRGTAIILVKSSNGKANFCVVKVTVPVTGVSLNKTNASVANGGNISLVATCTPSNTTESRDVTWSSSNNAVATVSDNGKVSARSVGTAVITITTSNGKTASCTVTVK